MPSAVMITVITAAALSGLADGASANARIDRDGISFRVPKGWQLTVGRINGVVDPVTVFTVSTFRIQRRDSSSGFCSAALQRAWRPKGAYVQLAEERDGASRARVLRRVPPRPRHFVLRATGPGGLCTPGESGQLSFQQGGRAFYVYYGFGRRAPKATRARAVALLDDMRIAPRR
jgi:hypothetical protein